MSTAQYLDVSQRLSRLLTTRYSTSFTWGIRVFPVEIRQAIFSIYGFVRVADEIVDSFYESDQQDLLARFRADTGRAISERISANPILHAFQDVVYRYQIPIEYIEAFLHSMEMDLSQSQHDHDSLQEYVYGSAEVVGLMCLKVFCHPDQALFAELLAPARALGSAFQKVNFLRDIKSDLDVRGRCYFPGVEGITQMTPAHKQRFEAEIESEFQQALAGIRTLPRRVRLAVYSVYLYYVALFKKLRACDLTVLLQRRVRIANGTKAVLFLRAVFDHVFRL